MAGPATPRKPVFPAGVPGCRRLAGSLPRRLAPAASQDAFPACGEPRRMPFPRNTG